MYIRKVLVLKGKWSVFATNALLNQNSDGGRMMDSLCPPPMSPTISRIWKILSSGIRYRRGGGKRRRISVGRMNLSRVGSNRKRRANLLRRVKLSCQVGGKLGGWVGRKNGKRSESGHRIFIQFDRERIRMNHLAVDVEGKKWKVSRSISRQS